MEQIRHVVETRSSLHNMQHAPPIAHPQKASTVQSPTSAGLGKSIGRRTNTGRTVGSSGPILKEIPVAQAEIDSLKQQVEELQGELEWYQWDDTDLDSGQPPGDGSCTGAVVVNTDITAHTADSVQYVAQHGEEGVAADTETWAGGEVVEPLPVGRQQDHASRSAGLGSNQGVHWGKGAHNGRGKGAGSNKWAGSSKGAGSKGGNKGGGRSSRSVAAQVHTISKVHGIANNRLSKVRQKVHLDHNTLSAALVMKLCNEPGN